MSSLSESLLFSIRATTGITLSPGSVRGVAGGSINACYRVTSRDGRSLFLKLNEPDCEQMFAAEFDGLTALRAAAAVRVPEPIAHGAGESGAWLLLEALDLDPLSAGAATRLGTALATQHRQLADQFGWRRDNTIGSTPQPNAPRPEWVTFFRTQRLEFQLGLAARNGHGGELQDKGARLAESLPSFFDGYRPEPSLLHGDLWSGNCGMMRDATPIIFDPAVYYGDREADIAMTRLFGGFPREFYVAYDAAWPLDSGFRLRKDIYNLYHVLNHLNLFGGDYLQQSVALMDRLLQKAS